MNKLNPTIQQMFDDYLTEENNKERKRSGKYSPSSFGGCYRKQYWNRKDEPKTNEADVRALRVFKCGSMFHKTVQDIIVANYPQAEVEVKILNDNICGYADIVLPNEVIELKSQHSRAFWWMEKENKTIEEMKPDHCLQVMSYCYFLNKPLGRLVYISKDDLCIAEYQLELTDEWKSKVENEVNNLIKIWKEDVLPEAKPRLYENKAVYKECQYCNWKDECFEIENNNGRGKPDIIKEE